MDKIQKTKAFERLLTIMDDLRTQCPWDRKQTIDSLRILTLEETYELCDAILDNDLNGVKEEIGDIMLHMVFYSRIAEETGSFDIGDAINDVCEKLIRRHPHIYGDLEVDNAEEVKKNWEQIKQTEGKKSVLSGVPKSLPALVKAYRMQEKTAQVGFEWDSKDKVWQKLEEEIQEFRHAAQENTSRQEIEEEFGDIMFSLINYARYIKIDPEASLERVNQKFKRRFEFIEANADKALEEMTLEEMDKLWDQAKSIKKLSEQ
jgi:XTP/dITP diphosphohydrolase